VIVNDRVISTGVPMSQTPELQVRAPLQERSRKTLSRILDAAWELLEEEGPDGMTVAAMTRKARASVGSFYARFGGKEDLLGYMGEAALEEALVHCEDLAPGSVTSSEGAAGARVESLVATLTALYLEGAGRRLALLEGIEDPHPTRRSRLEARLSHSFSDNTPFSARRSNLGVRILIGTLHDVAARSFAEEGEGGWKWPSREILENELVALLKPWLEGPPADAWHELEAGADEETAGEPDEVEPEKEPEEEASELDAKSAEESASQPDQTVVEPDPFDVWG
jgi:AcrR family transcriptional regulator